MVVTGKNGPCIRIRAIGSLSGSPAIARKRPTDRSSSSIWSCLGAGHVVLSLSIAGGLQWPYSIWNPWCCVALPSVVAVRLRIRASVPVIRPWGRPRQSVTPCNTRQPTRSRRLPQPADASGRRLIDLPSASNHRFPTAWSMPWSAGPVGPRVMLVCPRCKNPYSPHPGAGRYSPDPRQRDPVRYWWAGERARRRGNREHGQGLSLTGLLPGKAAPTVIPGWADSSSNV